MKAESRQEALVRIKNLGFFPVPRGTFRRKIGDIKAIDDVCFQLKRHETLGLVGESGCGKTTTGRCILRLYKPTAGQIIFNGSDISNLPERKLRPLRCGMGFIFQDPMAPQTRDNPREVSGADP